MAGATVQIEGLRELNRALAKAEKDVKRDAKQIMRDVAEPVATYTEQRAVTTIHNLGPRWAATRTGVTSKLVYVVPKAKNRGGSGRPNLGGLLLRNAYNPARVKYGPTFKREMETAMDKMAARFNRG